MNKQQELLATLQNLLSSASEDYYIDYYLSDFKPAKGINLSDRNKIINNTIKKYKEHHKDFQDKKMKLILEELHEIIKQDIVIYFEDILIYRELYKILFLLDSTFNAIKLVGDKNIYPCGFAKVQSDLKKVELFREHNKKNIIGDYRLHKSYRGQSRFRNWFTTIYIKNKTLAKFYTYMFLTADLAKVKDFHEDEEISKKLLIELEFILMQRTVQSKVTKSCGILLYYEMIKYLAIDRNSAEVYTAVIIEKLFESKFSSHELHKVIEIKSSLGFFPIFGASKKSSLKDNEKQFIHDKVFKHIQKNTSITTEELEPFFDSYIKNPHIQFLEKYPVELFRLNPKYSSTN